MPRCPLCSGPGAAAFVLSGHAHHTCRACGSLFVAPVPAPQVLGGLYREAREDLGSTVCWEASAHHAHATWGRALRDVRRLAGDGPLLDVGCGAGQFLAFARACAFGALHGLELAPAIAATARARSTASVQEADLLSAVLEPETFAAVTLWDVLEHLPDPRAALRRVRSLLRPGGLVVIGTPSRDGLTLRMLGRRARVVAPPEHLFLATRRGLAVALESEAFALVRLEAEQIRIRDWLPRERASSASVRRSAGTYARTYALLTGPAALAAQRAVNVVLRATRLGDQLLAIAQRN